jgi:hypothetical protein
MRSMRIVAVLVAPCLCLVLASGCATSLVRDGLSVSTGRWEMKLLKLTAGPGQYMTAAGMMRPPEGRRYVWATVSLRNDLKTPQVIRLDRVYLWYGGTRKKPCIIDMGAFVTVRADPAPKLRAGETIRRAMAYLLPAGVTPGKLVYENGAIVIPAADTR